MRRLLFSPVTSILAFLVVAVTASVVAGEKKVIVSVSARADAGYKRQKLPDGTFRPEFYAIANGGFVQGTVRDNTQEDTNIGVIVKAVTEHLAKQNYHLAPDTKAAELMLVLQWGRTMPFNDLNYALQVNATGQAIASMQNLTRGETAPTPEERMLAADELENMMVAMQMENRVRDNLNAANARLLGYMDDINDADGIARFAGGGDHFNDLVSDIEEARYYIIISAYDFRRLVDRNERKLRWVTRISIRVRGNKFGERVEEMVARAARYFGTNSGRLIREYEGTIEYGDAEVIGIVEDPQAPPPDAQSPPTPAAPDQQN